MSRLPYGLASDVWSFGCMMVTLLTGSPPFESVAIKSTLEKVSRVDYTIPSRLSLEAKDLIENLIKKVSCTNKDPKNRILLMNILKHPFFDSKLPCKPLVAPRLFPIRREPTNIQSEDILNLKNFSTEHLQPLNQVIKHGKIEITKNGLVTIDFKGEDQILQLNHNGSELNAINRNSSSVDRYIFPSIPEKYHKRIRYAARFLDLVRSKTQKANQFN